MRLIDADAAVKFYEDEQKWRRSVDKNDYTTLFAITNELKSERLFPTVDVRPVVHGRWIEGEKNRYWGTKGNYICSNCQSRAGYVKFNYCPNCGAKMDGGI